MDELRVGLDKLVEITKNLAIRCEHLESEFTARVESLETTVYSLADAVRKNAISGGLVLEQVTNLRDRLDDI